MIREIIEILFGALPQDVMDWLCDSELISAQVGSEIASDSLLMSVPSFCSFESHVEKRVILPPESQKVETGTTTPNKHETRSQGQQLSLF